MPVSPTTDTPLVTLAAVFVAGLLACADDGPTDLTPRPEIVVPDVEVVDTTPEITLPDPDADAETVDPDGEVTPPRAFIRKIELDVSAGDWQRLHADIHAEITIPAAVVVDGQRFEGGAVEAHGGYAREVPKKSYRVALPDEPDADLDLFGDGVERQRRFVLKAAWIDRSFLREPLAMQMVRDAGGLAPRIAFAELWVRGELLGLYQVVERIDRPYFRRQGLEDEHIQLYKAENHNANWATKADPASGYDIQIGDDDTADLGALLLACSTTPTTDQAFSEAVEPLVALEDVVAFQRVHTFLGNRDTFTKNYYLYHDRAAAAGTPAARFRLVSWDADAVFGLEWEGSNLPGDQRAWHGTDAFSPRLFSVPAWRARHLDGYDRALSAELAVSRLQAWVDAVAPEIAILARADLAGWQPTADWDAEVERLKDMIATRWTILREVIDALR
ncbi:MAG: CotH kinase family protein [Deltaproteobacteria bacterium]|nr:CotH kinase family protein [Deltaproteobacteria bacterium]